MITEICNKLIYCLSYQNDRNDKKQIKYSVVFAGLLPVHGKIFTDNIYLSEDNALPEAINEYILKDKWHTNKYIFDRGIQSGCVLSDFANKENVLFVGRLKVKRKHEVLESLVTEKTDLKWNFMNLTRCQDPIITSGRKQASITNLLKPRFASYESKTSRQEKSACWSPMIFNHSPLKSQRSINNAGILRCFSIFKTGTQR